MKLRKSKAFIRAKAARRLKALKIANIEAKVKKAKKRSLKLMRKVL